MKKALIFFRDMFLDDENEPCIARFSLFVGILLTTFTATVYMNTDGEVSCWEALARCCPALVGLVAYIFTRLFEQREWVADMTDKITKAKNNDQKTMEN